MLAETKLEAWTMTIGVTVLKTMTDVMPWLHGVDVDGTSVIELDWPWLTELDWTGLTKLDWRRLTEVEEAERVSLRASVQVDVTVVKRVMTSSIGSPRFTAQ